MPNLDEEIAVQHELNRQRKDIASLNRGETTEVTPAWMNTAQGKQIEALLEPIMKLLDNLTIVRDTHNQSAIEQYYQQVVKELTKVAYLQMRMINDSENLASDEKQQRLSTIKTQLKANILDIATQLGLHQQ